MMLSYRIPVSSWPMKARGVTAALACPLSCQWQSHVTRRRALLGRLAAESSPHEEWNAFTNRFQPCWPDCGLVLASWFLGLLEPELGPRKRQSDEPVFL